MKKQTTALTSAIFGCVHECKHVLLCVVDVDECVFAAVTGLQACGSGAVCTNTPGSFTCSCPAGFVLALHGHDCVGAFGVCGIHSGGGRVRQTDDASNNSF